MNKMTGFGLERALAGTMAFLFLVHSQAAPLGAENLIYSEEFDNLGDYVESFSEGASVSEAPASLKSLYFNPATPSFAKKDFFAVPACTNVYSFHFDFRLTQDEKNEFSLKFIFGEEDDAVSRSLTVSEAGSFFEGGRRRTVQKGEYGFAGRWQWNKGVVAVDGKKAALYLERGGKLVKEAEGEFPALPLSGWNLYSGTPLFLDGIRIYSGSLRLWREGDALSFCATFPREEPEAEAKIVEAPSSEQSIDAGELSATGEDIIIEYEGNGGANVELALADGQKKNISFSTPRGETFKAVERVCSGDGAFENISTNRLFADSHIMVSAPGMHNAVYAAPRLQHRYETHDAARIFAARDVLPRASKKRCILRIEALSPSSLTNGVWIDSRYAGQIALPAPVASLTARAKEGSSLSMRRAPSSGSGKYLALDAAGLDRPFGRLPDAASCSSDVPFIVSSGKNALNLAYCRENLGSVYLECNGYLQRSSFDGMPSSMHFSVPVSQYVRVHMLCAVDPNAPGHYVPEVTARLTKYESNGGRSQAACESTIVLPRGKDEAMPENVKLCGSLEDGTPLYHVYADFDIGSIQDLTSMLGLKNLDLDFAGPLWEKDTYYLSRKRSPSHERQSSVLLYGVTLERPEMEMTVTPNRKNSLYYPNEKAGATVHFRGNGAGYSFSVDVTDAKGKAVSSVTFPAVEGKKAIDYSISGFGHYFVSYTLRDSNGVLVMRHKGSFVLLPHDTRKAQYDSPYYVWNFRGAHGTPSSIGDYGDMLKRMGVRRTLLMGSGHAETNEAAKAYGLTHGQFPYLRPDARGGLSKDEAIEKMKERMRSMAREYPSCKDATIFHESGGGPFPMELLGGKTEVTEAQKKADKARVEAAIATAKAWREVDPSVRLIFGNSGFSLGLVASLFREGLPHDLIDAVGDESVGMTQPPELSVAYPAWMLRKLAVHYGYDDVWPDAPWEWKSRVIRHQGEEGFAAVKVRDALIAHAWNFKTIPLAGITEMANSYYDTIWGDAVFERWPLAYPHLCFTATATMTQILDMAKFVRVVPTGSLTAYCLEFKKPDNSYVYALWTARVKMPVKITPANASVQKFPVTGMLGESFRIDVGDDIVLTPSPVYISTEEPIKDIAVNREALDSRKPEKMGRIVEAFNSTNAVTIAGGADPRIESKTMDPPFLAFSRAGDFSIKNAEDGMGIELRRNGKELPPEIMQEYTFLELDGAEAIEEEISTVGVWIKGNSSWGKVYFELTDSEGEKWISAGTGGYGCVVYDWPAQASINFDGWHFVEFPLTDKSKVKVYSPGENFWQWQRDGKSGNGKIDYPVRMTGLGIGFYPRVLEITEMRESAPSVQIKDLTVY